jgi:hypothetical protein
MVVGYAGNEGTKASKEGRNLGNYKNNMTEEIRR